MDIALYEDHRILCLPHTCNCFPFSSLFFFAPKGYLLIKVREVRIAIEVKRSDDWWRFACGDVYYYFFVHSHAIKVGWSVQVHFSCGLLKTSYFVWIYLSSIHSWDHIKTALQRTEQKKIGPGYSVWRLLGLSRWPKGQFDVSMYQCVNVSMYDQFLVFLMYAANCCFWFVCKIEYRTSNIFSMNIG